MIKSKRISAGIYTVEYNGKMFDIERVNAVIEDKEYKNDWSWMLFEVQPNGTREYWNHFVSKKDAIHAIKNHE